MDVAEFKRGTAAYAGAVAELAALPNVRLLDLSSRICDDKVCHGLLGDKLAFTDDNHLSYAAARQFEPDFATFLTAPYEPAETGWAMERSGHP